MYTYGTSAEGEDYSLAEKAVESTMYVHSVENMVAQHRIIMKIQGSMVKIFVMEYRAI